MDFFTADTHFYHANILRYCNRGVATVKKMNRLLISNWNRVVGENDRVFILGDYGFWPCRERMDQITRELHGTKVLIVGNHDEYPVGHYIRAGISEVHSELTVAIGGFPIRLIHDPVAAIMARDLPHLCGHVHDLFRTEDNGRIINVGVDVWDITPVPAEMLYDAVAAWATRDHPAEIEH